MSNATKKNTKKRVGIQIGIKLRRKRVAEGSDLESCDYFDGEKKKLGVFIVPFRIKAMTVFVVINTIVNLLWNSMI